MLPLELEAVVGVYMVSLIYGFNTNQISSSDITYATTSHQYEPRVDKELL